jgi:hypothetical protein
VQSKVLEVHHVVYIVLNIHRFINLCDGDALFGTEDPTSVTPLPVDDRLWIENV